MGQMMAPHFSALMLLGLLASLVAVAAVSDIRTRTISNGLNLIVALLALPWWWSMGLSGSAMMGQIALAAGMLVLFAACFAAGMMGGGDVKLLAALALWLPFVELAQLLIWMALGGGVLTMAMLLRRRLAGSKEAIEVPYGVAIAGATLLMVTNHILTIRAA